jgi:hypothetical protein
MSAYQVSTDTIDLMVSVLVSQEWQKYSGTHYLYTYGEGPTEAELVENTENRNGYRLIRCDETTADSLGRELIAANVRSLTARYSDGLTMCGYFPDDYTWRRVTTDEATVAQAMGAVNCYRYQSCEFDGYTTSFANELVNRCMDRLIDMVAEGWDYERPANRGTVVSIFDLVGEA